MICVHSASFGSRMLTYSSIMHRSKNTATPREMSRVFRGHLQGFRPEEWAFIEPEEGVRKHSELLCDLLYLTPRCNKSVSEHAFQEAFDATSAQAAVVASKVKDCMSLVAQKASAMTTGSKYGPELRKVCHVYNKVTQRKVGDALLAGRDKILTAQPQEESQTSVSSASVPQVGKEPRQLKPALPEKEKAVEQKKAVEEKPDKEKLEKKPEKERPVSPEPEKMRRKDRWTFAKKFASPKQVAASLAKRLKKTESDMGPEAILKLFGASQEQIKTAMQKMPAEAAVDLISDEEAPETKPKSSSSEPKGWIDSSKPCMARLNPQGLVEHSKMKEGPSAFALASYDGITWFETEIPNTNLVVLKRPAAASKTLKRPAAAVGPEAVDSSEAEEAEAEEHHSEEQLAEEGQEEEALEEDVEVEFQDGTHQLIPAEAAPNAAPNAAPLEFQKKYKKECYYKTNSVGIRQSFLAKKQIFSLRSKGMEFEQLSKLADQAIQELENSNLSEEAIQAKYKALLQ